MGYSIKRYRTEPSGFPENYTEYIVDKIGDVRILPTNVAIGSEAYVIETATKYILNTKKNWVDSPTVLEVETEVKSFSELKTALQSGGIIDLQADVTVTEPLSISKSTTINLNGKKLVNETANARVINMGSNTDLVIEGGEIKGNTNGANPLVFVGDNCKCVIRNCKLTNATKRDVLKTNGTNDNAFVELDNCEIEGKVYLPAGGEYILNNCKVVGNKNCCYFKCGKITINGGEYICEGTDGDWAHYGNGFMSTGDAVIIEACGYPKGNPQIEINGGKFQGGVSSDASVYKNYGILMIDWRDSEDDEYNLVDVIGVKGPKYARGYVTGHVTNGSTPVDGWYHFNDENVRII